MELKSKKKKKKKKKAFRFWAPPLANSWTRAWIDWMFNGTLTQKFPAKTVPYMIYDILTRK